MQRFLLNLIRLGVSVSLLVYLVVEVQRSDPATFNRLFEAAPKWPALVLGWSCMFGSLAGGVVRWHIVLRALGISSRLRRLLRYSIFGYTLDFAALGTAGGDLAKAMLLARDRTGPRALVLISVLVDRVIGLHFLLTVSAFILLTSSPLGPELYLLRAGLIAAAAGMNLLLGLLWLAPGVGGMIERRSRAFGRYGKALADVIVALRRVRDHPRSLVPAAFVNLAALCFLVSGFFLIGDALPGAMPTFAEQWQIVPIAMLSAILPLPGGTLGALDYAMSFLYQHVTAGRVALGQGLVVVMVSRAVSLIVVGVAAALYLKSPPGGDP